MYSTEYSASNVHPSMHWARLLSFQLPQYHYSHTLSAGNTFAPFWMGNTAASIYRCWAWYLFHYQGDWNENMEPLYIPVLWVVQHISSWSYLYLYQIRRNDKRIPTYYLKLRSFPDLKTAELFPSSCGSLSTGHRLVYNLLRCCGQNRVWYRFGLCTSRHIHLRKCCRLSLQGNCR